MKISHGHVFVYQLAYYCELYLNPPPFIAYKFAPVTSSCQLLYLCIYLIDFLFDKWCCFKFQEPFNAHEFVERLAWKVIGKKSKNSYENFDPWSLHSAFEDVIKNLEEKNKQIERNIEKLEQSCKDEEKKHLQRVADLQRCKLNN